MCHAVYYSSVHIHAVQWTAKRRRRGRLGTRLCVVLLTWAGGEAGGHGTLLATGNILESLVSSTMGWRCERSPPYHRTPTVQQGQRGHRRRHRDHTRPRSFQCRKVCGAEGSAPRRADVGGGGSAVAAEGGPSARCRPASTTHGSFLRRSSDGSCAHGTIAKQNGAVKSRSAEMAPRSRAAATVLPDLSSVLPVIIECRAVRRGTRAPRWQYMRPRNCAEDRMLWLKGNIARADCISEESRVLPTSLAPTTEQGPGRQGGEPSVLVIDQSSTRDVHGSCTCTQQLATMHACKMGRTR